MRASSVALTLVAALSLTFLTACSAPNTEAADAARTYTAELRDWADDLVKAAAEEPERAGDGGVTWPQLADVLDEAPLLDREVGPVEDGNPHRRIVPIADRVEGIVAELAALEDSPVLTSGLTSAVSLAGSANLSRFYERAGALSDVVFDTPTGSPDRDRIYLDARVAFWQGGIESIELYRDEVVPLLPDTVHGRSLAAFVEAQATRITAGLETAIGTATIDRFPPMFDVLGSAEPLFEATVVAPHYARGELTAALVDAVDQLATAAEERTAGEGGSEAALPRASDAYRLVVVDRLPTLEALSAETRSVVDPEHYAAQWLLWRVAELDGLEAGDIADASALIGLRARDGDEVYGMLHALEDIHGFVLDRGPSGLQPLQEDHVEAGVTFEALAPHLLTSAPVRDAIDRYRDTVIAAYATTRVDSHELDRELVEGWDEAVAEAEAALDEVRELAADDVALRDALTEVLAASRN
jgi:hypothetical protein